MAQLVNACATNGKTWAWFLECTFSKGQVWCHILVMASANEAEKGRFLRLSGQLATCLVNCRLSEKSCPEAKDMDSIWGRTLRSLCPLNLHTCAQRRIWTVSEEGHGDPRVPWICTHAHKGRYGQHLRKNTEICVFPESHARTQRKQHIKMQFTLVHFRQGSLHWLKCTVIAVILWRSVAFVLKSAYREFASD